MSKCRKFLHNPSDFFHLQLFIIFSTFLIVTTLCSVLAQVHLSISLFLILCNKNFLHKKLAWFDWGSGAECVACAGGLVSRSESLVRFTHKLRHSSAADRQAPEQPVQHILILAQLFSRHCCRLIGVGVELFSPHTDTSVIFCVYCFRYMRNAFYSVKRRTYFEHRLLLCA